MKVYELINQLKGTTSTLEQIKQWSYMNRVPPCELEEGLELDCEFPEVLAELRDKLCPKARECQSDCLNVYFEMEIPEDKT